MRRSAPASIALLLALACTPSFAAPLKIADFSLPDTDGKKVSLKDFAGKKAVVVVFIGTECPVNNAYMPILAQMAKDQADKGVQFLAINSQALDTPIRVAAHAKDNGITFPVLKDTGNVVADLFTAERTPEAFVLTPDGTVVYRGRIDDQIGVGFKRPAPTRRDLAEALTEVLAGKPVSVPQTPAAGCVIARARKPSPDGVITFSKHVAPILQKNCQECHRPGQVGPMPLLTFEDALAWAGMIKEVVSENRMPPWHADPKHGQWANDRSLSKEEKAALLAWVAGGCARGDPKDLPPPRQFADAWRIGKPDAVLTFSKDETVAAKADRGLRYRYVVVPTNFDEDRWVQAAEARAGNRAVVHHIIVYVLRPGAGRDRTSVDGIGAGFLTAYVPGDEPAIYPAGAAKKIPKGANLVFQMHYTPNGVEQTDRSSIALVFAKQPPAQEVKTRAIAQQLLFIPPGDDNYGARAVSTFKEDTDVFSLMPHMHLRGKDFSYKVVYPDGKEEALLSVPCYDFAWQATYRFVKPLRLPAGSRIECVAHFDNSAKNPNNPDPQKLVRWGEQTWDEMMIGFVDYAPAAKK
jgi:peroxiredoxin